jgi:cytochrome P450
MSTLGISLAERYDPLGSDLADPYPTWALARQYEPVFRSTRVVRGVPVWVVTTYDLVAEAAADGERFSSSVALMPLVSIHDETFQVLAMGYERVPTIVEVDGDEHRRLSGPVKQVLNRDTGVRHEAFIAATVERLIDQMVAAGERQADIIAAFCHELPFQVINHLYGVDPADYGQIREWCAAWMRFLSTDLDAAAQVEAAKGMQAYFGYMAELVRDRLAHPRDDDLVTIVARHREGNLNPLSEADLVNSLAGILLAGHVTTTTLLGNALQILLDEQILPGQRRYWDDIIASQAGIPAIIEETLRYRTPTKSFFRLATTDTSLGGVSIRAGDILQLCFGSAHHDAAKWANPEVFDPSVRRSTPLLSFGWGPHYCLGAPLARYEARIALEGLSRRLPGLRLPRQEYEYLPMVILHGFRKLMVDLW